MILSLMPTAVFAAAPAGLNWVKLPKPDYLKVTSMETISGYHGFVIADAGSTAENNHFLYSDGSSGTAMIQSIASPKVPQLWFWDEGRLYCIINGTPQYLVSWYTSSTELGVNGFHAPHISQTTDPGQATVWHLEVVNNQTRLFRYEDQGNPYSAKHYLYLNPDKIFFTDSQAALIKNATRGVDIYAHHEHSSDAPVGYAALAGTTNYSFSTGTSTTQQIMDQIHAGASVWVHSTNVDTNDHSSAQKTGWDDSRLTLTWDKTLNPNYPGTYTATVKYGVMELGEITVSVQDKKATSIALTSGRVLYTQLNTQPNYSSVQATITYEDSSTKVVSGNNLVFKADTVNLTQTGVYPVDVHYHGYHIGTTFVRVTGDPYSHLPDEGVSDIPEFPDPGAVRWNKTASGLNYENTGVAQVELTVSGVSKPGNVDVVLVVDVSNSMGWSMDWFEGMSDAQVSAAKDNVKIPKNGIYGTTKLDIAMDSAEEFAKILLDTNQNNTLSFVTFAGQNGSHSSNIDSVQTPFLKVTDSASAIKSFQNTVFTGFEKALDSNGNEKGSVTYRLKIADQNGNTIVAGVNRGNTNYDYAFGQAMDAVNQIKSTYSNPKNPSETYDESNRQLYVVFMTDGAPSHYNGRTTASSADQLWNSSNTYQTVSGDTSYVYDSWTQWILQKNALAKPLYDAVDGFYPIGFDLAHGGFGVHSWDLNVMENVLKGLVDDTNDLNVTMANDSAALQEAFREMANRFSYAGTSAVVTDTVGSSFTLYTGTESDVNDPTVLKDIPNEITVKAYELYTRDEIGQNINGHVVTVADVGTRKTDSQGNYLYKVVERVTFTSDNGETTGAYSDLLPGLNILFTETRTTDGSIVIAGVYFTYTKESDGTETFDWNIGTITDHQIALCYNVYLKGAFDDSNGSASPTAKLYDTNKSAYLDFVDINGRHAHRVFPVPKLPWGKASATVRFYLVNNQGEYVNHAGHVFSEKANRVFLPETVSYEGVLGSADSNTLDKISATALAAYTAAGLGETTYTLYGPAAESRFWIANSTTGVGKASHNTNDSDDKIFIWGTNATMQQAYVEIPVVLNDLIIADYRLLPKQIVIDYGKRVDFDVFLEQELPPSGSPYTLSVAGFAPFNATHNQKQYVASDAFASTFVTPYGTYSIKNSDTISFTPTAMLDKVEKVFVAVKIQHKTESTNYYYMFKEVDIIPATIMYYETDFASGVFRTTGAWTTVTEGPAADAPQNAVEIGTDLYGFDTSYENDSHFSNGSSLMVLGTSPAINTPATETSPGQHPETFASFDFTGTGFEIISRTGDQEGLIVVTVTSHGGGFVHRIFEVLNKSERNLELYQVPVVSMNDLPFGSYTVTIDVIQGVDLSGKGYSAAVRKALERGSRFHFDAVRVYNPIDVSNASAIPYSPTFVKHYSDAEIAYTAYLADGEAHAQVIEVRNELIDNGTYGASSNKTTVDRHNSGVLVIGGAAASAEAGFDTIGPNNEVYLQNGQAIGLALDLNGALPDSLHISAKSANGAAVTLATQISQNSMSSALISRVIQSSTAQCFDLLGNTSLNASNPLYLVIHNAGDGILSITDLQVAYDTSTPGSIAFIRDKNILDTLVQRVKAAQAAANN